MGFGNAVATEDDLINSVKAIVNADCAMSEEYKRIADSFFKLNDKPIAKGYITAFKFDIDKREGVLFACEQKDQ